MTNRRREKDIKAPNNGMRVRAVITSKKRADRKLFEGGEGENRRGGPKQSGLKMLCTGVKVEVGI